MNRYAMGILILATCSSCSVYQYNVLSSDMKGADNKPFVVTNDTLEIRYSFSDGSTHINIFNKSTKPLYLDWSRSAMIADGNSYPYWLDQSAVDLTTRISLIPSPWITRSGFRRHINPWNRSWSTKRTTLTSLRH